MPLACPSGGLVNRVHHAYELGDLDIAQVTSELGTKFAERVAENLNDYRAPGVNWRVSSFTTT